MRKTRFQLKAVHDNLWDCDYQWVADLPMNTPIMFVRLKNNRYGFRRLEAKVREEE